MNPSDSEITRIRDLGVLRLERIFRPSGLPLVRKDPHCEHATTALLVRGQAGAGKTTLVAALAHAIAKHGDGIALFLNTEALASELRYKAEFLDLPAGTLLGWSERHDARVGAIVTQHVELTTPGQDARDPKARRLASFGAVEAMLQEVEITPSSHPPIRVIVLDGFTLPGAEPEPPDLRHEVISFLQEMEARGITPILVEEMGQRGFEWMPFVVDLVLELALDQDPDTGKLIRRLRVPKSRFSRCHPGPHDYGVENDRPTLWPDPLDVLGKEDSDQSDLPPDFIWPDTTEDRYLLLSGPGVIASYYDRPEANILRPHFHTPGIRTLKVVCGSEIEVWRDGKPVASVRESDGPYALAWCVLGNARGCNFISIGQMPGLMRRQRFRLPLLHMLDALARAGKRVCVHGEARDLESTDNLGTILLPILRHRQRTIHTMERRELLSGIRWVDPPGELFDVEAASSRDLEGAVLLSTAAKTLMAASVETLLEMHRDFLIWQDESVAISLQPGQAALYLLRDQPLPATLASAARLAFMMHRVGDLELARSTLARVRRWTELSAVPALHSCVAWVSALIGENWHAARIISRALRREDIGTLDRALWSCLRLTYVESSEPLDVFISELREGLYPWQTPLCAAFLANRLVALYGIEASFDRLCRILRRSSISELQIRRLIVDAAFLTRKDSDRQYSFQPSLDLERTLTGLALYEFDYNIGVMSVGDFAVSYFKKACAHPLLGGAAKAHMEHIL